MSMIIKATVPHKSVMQIFFGKQKKTSLICDVKFSDFGDSDGSTLEEQVKQVVVESYLDFNNIWDGINRFALESPNRLPRLRENLAN